MTFSLIEVLIVFELILITIWDFRFKKISLNWIFLNLLIFMGHSIWLSFSNITPQILIFPILSLVLGFILFSLKIMGGGDSKLISSLFLLIPYNYHFDFFIGLIYSTLFFGTIFWIYHILKKFDQLVIIYKTAHWALLKEILSSKFSYAIVILFGWMYMIWARKLL